MNISASPKTLVLVLSTFLVTHSAKAENSFEDFLKNTEINGQLRDYYFTRTYSNPDAIDQAAFSAGGYINILTGALFGGLKAGATLYTAQPLGLNSNNSAQVDNSLPGTSLTALGQAFLQYERNGFLIRAGDQLIDTPWIEAAGSRMIPNTYRGFYGAWSPNAAFKIMALRIYAFKSRIADDFTPTNIYNPQNQGKPIAALGDTTDDGAQALGFEYKQDSINAKLWGYQFFDFAKMLYGEIKYTFKNQNDINPFVGVQYLTESGDGTNVLAQVSTGAANSTAYGAIIGVEAPRFNVNFSYNKIPANENAFSNGNIVSPYTYTSDPLYTRSMIAGMVDKAPGDAIKLEGIIYAYDKQLKFLASYAKYYTDPYQANTNETDVDISYSFKKSQHKSLRGLTIRNRLGIQTGNPSQGIFYYNRVMLQYDF